MGRTSKKLNIRFHNPNTKEDTFKLVAQMFVDASKVKLDEILKEAAMEGSTLEDEYCALTQ